MLPRKLYAWEPSLTCSRFAAQVNRDEELSISLCLEGIVEAETQRGAAFQRFGLLVTGHCCMGGCWRGRNISAELGEQDSMVLWGHSLSCSSCMPVVHVEFAWP